MPAFPADAHLKGGRNAAPVLAALAREFYEPIIPIVMELRRQGLSLRAIARELEQRGIKPRYEFPRWSAAQVRRVVLRGSQQAAAPTSPTQAAPALPKVAAPVLLADIKFLVNGRVYGSYTEEQVWDLLYRRRVTPDTQATRIGMAGWRPLNEVIELRST
jgi:hypothetical protein